jgi:uncharacterized membrane protein YedE/YeeE
MGDGLIVVWFLVFVVLIAVIAAYVFTHVDDFHDDGN